MKKNLRKKIYLVLLGSSMAGLIMFLNLFAWSSLQAKDCRGFFSLCLFQYFIYWIIISKMTSVIDEIEDKKEK